MDKINLVYKKSSFSERRSRCVSVAVNTDNVFVKHSIREKPVLKFSREEWEAFIQGVKIGEFDFPKY